MLNFNPALTLTNKNLSIVIVKKETDIERPADCNPIKFVVEYMTAIVIITPVSCEKNIKLTFFSACIIEPRKI